MASTEDPSDKPGDKLDPAPENGEKSGGDNADSAGPTDKERALSERVRRKIKSVSSKNKRYLN